MLPGGSISVTLVFMAKHRKRRIPQLSQKPELTSGRYYTSFRDESGRPRRKRFSTDRRASEITYHRWVVENYDQASTVITNEGPDGTATDTSLPVIANAYVQHEKQRARPETSRHTRGTISLRVFHDERKHIVNILSWCSERYGDKFKTSPFDRLMTETDYEQMMLHFVANYSDSQVNKHRQRFWEIVRFARRAPFSIRIPFGREDVRRFGGTETRKARKIPSVKIIQSILEVAALKERLWLWMGMGLGFGNDDLARARLVHFDADSYDMRRGKTGFPRFGEMRPMVWKHLQAYLRECPREPDDLLFVTANGNPLVWMKVKTEDELLNGTATRGPSVMPYKRTDNVVLTWNRLKNRAGIEDWKEGFYVWRHLGATAYAARPGIGIAQLRTFLGHGKSNAADEYLKPLTPETKEVVAWVNRMLDSDDPGAWKKKPKKKSVKELP